jgi:formylglycine-generating enzyme required for sulfatase activity/serine/threonine protein kinase
MADGKEASKGHGKSQASDQPQWLTGALASADEGLRVAMRAESALRIRVLCGVCLGGLEFHRLVVCAAGVWALEMQPWRLADLTRDPDDLVSQKSKDTWGKRFGRVEARLQERITALGEWLTQHAQANVRAQSALVITKIPEESGVDATGSRPFFGAARKPVLSCADLAGAFGEAVENPLDALAMDALERALLSRGGAVLADVATIAQADKEPAPDVAAQIVVPPAEAEIPVPEAVSAVVPTEPVLVRHVSCSAYVNEGERRGVEAIIAALHGADVGPWVVMSNVFVSSKGKPLGEVDAIVIGPPGLAIVEIKNFDAESLKQDECYKGSGRSAADEMAYAARKTEGKARTVKGIVQELAKKHFAPMPFVKARILLARDSKARYAPLEYDGVAVFGIPEILAMCSASEKPRWTPEVIHAIAKEFEPNAALALGEEICAFAGVTGLKRFGDVKDSFRRIYRGLRHGSGSAPYSVQLHVYDLTVSAAQGHAQALLLAEREFEVIRRWQKLPYVPAIIDSLQAPTDYPGEMLFYVQEAPARTWWAALKKMTLAEQLGFACQAMQALAAFHAEGLIHRRIAPFNLCMRANGSVVFVDYSLARIEDARTVSSSLQIELGKARDYAAPEVRVGGLAAGERKSDVYALCKSLLEGFTENDALAVQVKNLLQTGCADDQAKRPDAAALLEKLQALQVSDSPQVKMAAAPEEEFDVAAWVPGLVLPFQSGRYRLCQKLGSGGVGETWRVDELGATGEVLGPYVAKRVSAAEDGTHVLGAYRRVRAATARNPHLATIHEVAAEWHADRVVALLRWVDGRPLSQWQADLRELPPEACEARVLRWLAELCGALAALHSAGVVHGDVSPENIVITLAGEAVLTDFDTAALIGSLPLSAGVHGNSLYKNANRLAMGAFQPADDLFALAGAMFRSVFSVVPFTRNGELRPAEGLNLAEVAERQRYPVLLRVLEAMTSASVTAESVLALLCEEPRIPRFSVPVPGKIFADAEFSPRLIVLPTGEYLAGASEDDPGRLREEGPRVQVHIDYPLAVGVTPVTFAEWDVYALETNKRLPDDRGWGRGRRPVVDVSWDDATAYLAWLSAKTGHQYTLLSEAEWEYAARAGSEDRYPWGQDSDYKELPNHAWFLRNSDRRLQPVGLKPANAFGLHDMCGLVKEWVADTWANRLDGGLATGEARQSLQPGARRVTRGGSYSDLPRYLRVTQRDAVQADLQSPTVGFRVARRF